MPLVGVSVRSKSIPLVANSVGLRRSEIDGHYSSHLCPQRCSPTLCRPVVKNSDRKFGQAIDRHSCTIQINTIGCRFGRATSLGDRRPLKVAISAQRCSPTLCRPVSKNSDRKFDQAIGRHSCTIPINTIGCLFGRAASLGDRRPL